MLGRSTQIKGGLQSRRGRRLYSDCFSVKAVEDAGKPKDEKMFWEANNFHDNCTYVCTV